MPVDPVVQATLDVLCSQTIDSSAPEGRARFQRKAHERTIGHHAALPGARVIWTVETSLFRTPARTRT